MRLLFLFLIVLTGQFLQAQPVTQTMRGNVYDKLLNQSLPGATVVVLNTNPLMGATADIDGAFKIIKIPVGTYNIQVSYLGYETTLIPNVIISSGKETVLTIELEESLIEADEVIITADGKKDQPLNEMNTTSTRTFSVDETQRYAAAVNDPGRMVISYAGVVSADDGNNDISIRGNSPNGLLWRMEGIEIPNPNHFSDAGSSGGGISILNAQILANSDFMTGAFPAEYGNALSGVFDLRLRKGNNEKLEFTGQAGFLGLSAAVEGPFKKEYKGSYLINYRYSTLSVLTKIGILDDSYATNFQDLSYNVFLPTKKLGNFSLFGFGGLSNQTPMLLKDSAQWEHFYDRYGGTYFSNTGAAGFTNSFLIGSRTYLKTALVVSTTNNGEDVKYVHDDYSTSSVFYSGYLQNKQSLSSVLNNKINSRLSLRSGIVFTRWQYNLIHKEAESPDAMLTSMIDETGYTYLSQAFMQVQFRFTEQTRLIAGLHHQMLWLNHSQALEPRISLEHYLKENQTISLGYGMHSQPQPIGVYFSDEENDGSGSRPNENLGFSKAHHLVLSYSYRISENLRIKSEAYCQGLYHIPVSKDSATSYSMVNSQGEFETQALQGTGTGKNYGVELTAEKFLSNRSYFLLSSSFFQSKYKGSDGIERNTRWNSRYNVVFTGGKEFSLSKENNHTLLGINAKVIYAGGFWDTPIDLNASVDADKAVYDRALAYSVQNPDYFRIDAGISLKLNRPRLTSTFLLDLQNVTNRQNVFGQYYDPDQQTVVTYYSTPLIPVLSYRIQF